MPRSTPAYGIDTSVFVRLLTGHPAADFEKTVASLKRLHDIDSAAEFFVSNQVIGEACITLQHFYQISKTDARKAIMHLFNKAAVSPLNGQSVLKILQEKGGAGLMDRLIAQEYIHGGVKVLTNDKRMAKLDGVILLS